MSLLEDAWDVDTSKKRGTLCLEKLSCAPANGFFALPVASLGRILDRALLQPHPSVKVATQQAKGPKLVVRVEADRSNQVVSHFCFLRAARRRWPRISTRQCANSVRRATFAILSEGQVVVQQDFVSGIVSMTRNIKPGQSGNGNRHREVVQ